jgi:cytidine deaminase
MIVAVLALTDIFNEGRLSCMDLALVGSASVARRHAYAPYSGYEVGAAVKDEEGRIFTGCNVENASYGLSICAERVAINKMISEGSRKIDCIAIVTKDGGMPCGACLQVMFEFAEEPSTVEILVANENGDTDSFMLTELLPHGFESGG